jgi:hypothetical protein
VRKWGASAPLAFSAPPGHFAAHENRRRVLLHYGLDYYPLGNCWRRGFLHPLIFSTRKNPAASA